MSGARLWVLAGLCLLLYGIGSYLGFRSWQASHQADAVVALAEAYKRTRGVLPDCESDSDFAECSRLGLEQPHAFYTKKSDTRYVVDYFGTLGITHYDSATAQWQTGYWWTPKKFKELAQH